MNLGATEFVKMAVFDTLNQPNLISRKIYVNTLDFDFSIWQHWNLYYTFENGTFYLVFPTLNAMVRFLPEKVGKDCLSIYYFLFCSVVSYKKLRKRNTTVQQKNSSIVTKITCITVTQKLNTFWLTTTVKLTAFDSVANFGYFLGKWNY